MSKNNRLKKLENKVLDMPKPGSTRLLLEDDNEIALLDTCQQIKRNWNLNGDLTPNERFLLDRIGAIAFVRACDIFTNIVGGRFYGDNKEAYFIFHIRFLQFLNKVSEECRKIRKEKKT